MRYERGVIVAKSEPGWFDRELAGKHATLRVVPIKELVEMARCTEIRIEDESTTAIAIQHEITDISDVTDADGRIQVEPSHRMVMICWRPALEAPHHHRHTIGAREGGCTVLTTQEAAAELGVNASRIRQLILSGRLKARKRGQAWEIDPADLDAVRNRPPGSMKGKIKK